MWRKICNVFSHSGEYKNEMILSRFRGKSRLKNDCINIVFLHKHLVLALEAGCLGLLINRRDHNYNVNCVYDYEDICKLPI